MNDLRTQVHNLINEGFPPLSPEEEILSPFEAQAIERLDHIVRLLQRMTLVSVLVAAKWDLKELEALTKLIEQVEK